MTQLSRRAFLRGCGAAVALPWLEVLAASKVERPPLRAAFFYIPNGVVQSVWHPKEVGKKFELSPTLSPLQKMKEKITVFTNLDRVKVKGTDGHAQASTCWLSSAAPDQLSPAGYPLKRTLDQIIAREVGRSTPFRSLELSCNPYEDNRESVYFDNISWHGHGHVASSMRDPKQVFNRLFAVEKHATNKSVLDLIGEDVKSLQRDLGQSDRKKLDEYLDSVRTVEKQIDRVTKRQAELNRIRPKAPVKRWQAMTRSEHIQVMGDLMILALQSRLTRVATLMTGPERWGSPLKVQGLFVKPIQHHSMTHQQHNARVRKDLEKLDRFHVEQFARLVAKMDAITEGESTLLDNMIFTLGSGLSSGSLHICTDLPTVIAGGGGGRITTGRHVRSKKGTPIANLWLSMVQSFGIKRERIGDSTGALVGLKG